MASPTSIFKLKIQVSGDESWGPTTEQNLNRLEEAIASEVLLNTTGGTVTLTETDYLANQARRAVIRVTGTLASGYDITVPVPNSVKTYVVYNATSGSFDVRLRFGSGSYRTIKQDRVATLIGFPDGTCRFAGPMMSTGGYIELPSPPPTARTDAAQRAQIDDRVITLKDKDLNTPAVGPASEDAYHLGNSPTGAWSGQGGKIARYNGSTWLFSDVPTEGLLAWVVDEGKLYISDGGTLTDIVGGGGIADGAVTAAKLASSAVETAKIADANVTEAKIASNAVALAKFKSDVYASESEAKTQSNTTKIVTADKIKHAAFPAGTRILFQQTAAPTGWTKDTTHNNKAIRLVSGTVGTGGSATFSSAFASRSLSGTVGNTTLTASQIPEHDHFVAAAASSIGAISASNQMAETGAYGNNAAYVLAGSSTAATVGKSSPAGSGSSHTHTLSMNALDMAVQYVDFTVAEKDAP